MLEDMCHALHPTVMALGHLSDFILCCSESVVPYKIPSMDCFFLA